MADFIKLNVKWLVTAYMPISTFIFCVLILNHYKYCAAVELGFNFKPLGLSALQGHTCIARRPSLWLIDSQINSTQYAWTIHTKIQCLLMFRHAWVWKRTYQFITIACCGCNTIVMDYLYTELCSMSSLIPITINH